jgi:hypothetical protein
MTQAVLHFINATAEIGGVVNGLAQIAGTNMSNPTGFMVGGINILRSFGKSPAATAGANNKTYPFAEGGFQNPATTSFEKLGFVMHGASPEKHLNIISDNTTVIKNTLINIEKKIEGAHKSKNEPPNTLFFAHLPQLA